MKVFGNGRRRKKPAEHINNQYIENDDGLEYYEEDNGLEPSGYYDDYDGSEQSGYYDDDEGFEPSEYYEDEPFNEYGESETEVNDIIAGYRRKKRRRRITVLSILVVLVAGITAAYFIFVRPPELIMAPPQQEDAAMETGVAAEPGETSGDETQEYVDNGYRKEYRYTFLVLGVDQIRSNTDTILVGTLDIKDYWLHVVSIPRDTLVNVPWSAKKINTVYASSQLGYDGWDFENGIDGLKQALVDIMGYEPDCWAVIDIVAFQELVDAIGGVYYDVPIDMNYIDPDQDLVIDIKAGYQWLSGEDALKVVQFRSGYAMADIGRIETQQDFIKSVASQLLDLGNIPNIRKVYDVYEQYVETNLTVGNIAWFVQEFLKLSPEDITFETLPANYSVMIPTVNGLSYCSIYIDEWLEMLNTQLSPLDAEITADDLNILTWDSVLGTQSTTGEVAGGQYSFATSPSS